MPFLAPNHLSRIQQVFVKENAVRENDFREGESLLER